MVKLAGSVFEAGPDILHFQVRKILQDGPLGFSRRQQIQHILDANAHPPAARPAPALIRAKGDALGSAHGQRLVLTDRAASPPYLRDRRRPSQPGAYPLPWPPIAKIWPADYFAHVT